MNDITVTQRVHFRSGRQSRKAMRDGDAAMESPVGRIPRVSRLMALAIRFEQLIRDGVVADQAEIARLGHVSRARVSQIMNLLNLAPDIQETLLSLPRVERGRDPVTERELRAVAVLLDWELQRDVYRRAGDSAQKSGP